jgi:two-component system, cell cycle sensor histidine kinase and response regulator CckA
MTLARSGLFQIRTRRDNTGLPPQVGLSDARSCMSTGVQRATNEDKLELSQALSQLNEKVLGMIRAQAPLPKILEVLCEQIEKQHCGLLCSVLLLDADGTTLRHGAAPGLPMEYSRAVDGIQIGPCAGSCGTAAYRKQPVVVSDIATDPLWASCRQVALPHGLRACWSTPIASQDGKILGTFAIYYREPRTPDAEHLQLITHATHLAGIAIEHDRAKAELRAAEARYRTLVERLPAITYIAELGAGGPWHYVSPQIETMLGFSPAEWLSDPMNWMNHIHPDDREVALAAEKLFQETHELFQSEYRMCARDGRLLWFRDEGVLLQTDGQGLLMQGVMYDITERKRLEDQLRHSQKMEAVGQLAGGVAHDFNNLLMLIQAHNEHLRERLAPDDPARKDALGIENAVTRAASLTAQLLAFSRKQVLRPKVLDLNAVLADVAKMLHRLIGENIEVKVVPAPSLGRVKADPGQMEQVILNLAVNSRDAMPQGGRLTIETRDVELDENDSRSHEGAPAGKYVMLTVSDSGSGMDTETQAHIFEPFFTTKAPGKGTGLGLATVYGVVKQSDGWIWVDSEPGRGTKFNIHLPRVEESRREDSRGKESEAEESQAQAQLASKTVLAQATAPKGTETVLVVEDQDGIRDIVRESLRRNGYNVLIAVDGNEALQMASVYSDPIHLLVTDLVMPNIGGRELAQRLTPLRPRMKVLFMSGYSEHSALNIEATNQPATILQKPFSLDALARNVRRVLDEPEL